MNKKRRKLSIKKIVLFLLFIIAIILFFSLKKNYKTQNNQLITNNSTSDIILKENKTNVEPSIVDSLTEEQVKASQDRGLPVLMYHFFYDEQAGETGSDNNFIEIHDFEEQIKYLADNNYYIPSWNEVLNYISGSAGLPEKSVIITVDDGDESFFKLAVPVLEKYNYSATSFVVTSWYGHLIGQYKSPAIDYQSHSDNMHISGSDGKGAFLTLSYNEACADLEQSRSILGGNTCTVFCYPFGHYNENCEKILKDCKFTLAFTTKGGRVFPGMNPLELPRVRMSKGDTLESFINKVK